MAANNYIVPGLQERLTFLTDASHLLAASSPETTAHLMRHRADLISQYDIPVTDAEKQHVCTGCGSISTPGLGSTLAINSGIPRLTVKEKAVVRKLARKNNKSKSDGKRKAGAKTNTQQPSSSSAVLQRKRQREGASKTTTCRRCYTFTKARLPVPPASLKFSQRRKKVVAATTQAATSSSKSQPATAKSQPANAAFVTPAAASGPPAGNKKRKKGKNNGLQALLAGQKKPAGSSFSLADFRMK